MAVIQYDSTTARVIAELEAQGWTSVVVYMDPKDYLEEFHYYNSLDTIKEWCASQGMQHKETYRIIFQSIVEPPHKQMSRYTWMFQNKQDAVLWSLRWL